ncbi:hypothetical protein HW555_002150, partial [Spodoptera exigua]
MIMMTFIDISRIVTLTFSQKYRNVTQEFLTKIHLFYFKDKSEYAMKVMFSIYYWLLPRQETSFTLSEGLTVISAKYSEEELVEVSKKLTGCVDYHRMIVKFTNKVSDVFGPMLFAYYIFHQTSGCLLLLECSQMTAPALMRYLPLTIILTQQLIQLSVIFELIGSESEKVLNAVYSVPWECMDPKTRKMLAFFLMNGRKPIHVKALGVANVGVTSMAAV